MAKMRLPRKQQTEDTSVELATYSVRFTDSERELLSRAAALRGWSPTNLIRQAALEWATAIINESAQTSFKRLALTLAEQAAKRRFYVVRAIEMDNQDAREFDFRASEEELAEFYGPADNPYLKILGVRPETPELSSEIVAEINKAAKYGGVEFVRFFVDYVEGMAAPEKLDTTKIVVRPNSE